MAEGKTLKTDLIMLVVVLGAIIAAFWMTGSAILERIDVVNQKADILQMQNKEVLQSIANVHDAVRAQKAAAGGANAAPAPAPAPAKPAPAPAKK